MSQKFEDVVVLFCAPQSQYPNQPSDISPCRLIDCPECKKPMWLSQKKEGMMGLAKSMSKQIICECYICFKKRVKEKPECLIDHVRIDI